MRQKAPAGSDRAKGAQQRAIEMKLEEMLVWYADASGGRMPEAIAEDKRTYRGLVLRWLEPLLPGQENPVLIEEALGDAWTLRLEPIADSPLVKV